MFSNKILTININFLLGSFFIIFIEFLILSINPYIGVLIIVLTAIIIFRINNSFLTLNFFVLTILLQNILLGLFSEFFYFSFNYQLLKGVSSLIVGAFFIFVILSNYAIVYKRLLYFLFFIFILYGFYGLLDPLVNITYVLNYLRLFVIPLLMFYIGLHLSKNVSINNFIYIFILIIIPILILSFIEKLYPLEVSSFFHYYSISGSYDNAHDYIDRHTRSAFNTKLIDDFELYRINSVLVNPVSFAYIISLFSILSLYKNHLILYSIGFIFLLTMGVKGALLLLFIFTIIFIFKLYDKKRYIFVSLFFYTLGIGFIAYQENNPHIVGFLFGVSNLFLTPQGYGIGYGGNLSFSTLGSGRTYILGTESALGVLFTQVGIFSLVYLYFFIKVFNFLFNHGYKFIATIVLFSILNGMMQEEAFSPYALGLIMLIAGIFYGDIIKARKKNYE